MRHQGTKTIETARLILRPFAPEDGDAMFRNWAGDPEVTRYLTWQPHADADVSRRLTALWAEEAKKPDVYQWAIVPKEPGEPIGSLSVVALKDDMAAAELGYCIGRPWWGQGLTAEGLRAVIEYLIREVGMMRVTACHDIQNPRSGRVMEKAGMRREGILRGAGRNNRGIIDLVQYAILPEDLDAEAGFRPLARSRQALSAAECLELLEREKRGVLSVLGDQGYPYGMPINHWYNPEDGKIYFHSGPAGHKIDAIRRESRASYCVLDAGTPESEGWALNFKSVIVFGRLEIVEDHEQALEISRRISYKFTSDQDYIEDEVRSSGARVLCFALRPEQISGKRVNEK